MKFTCPKSSCLSDRAPTGPPAQDGLEALPHATQLPPTRGQPGKTGKPVHRKVADFMAMTQGLMGWFIIGGTPQRLDN